MCVASRIVLCICSSTNVSLTWLDLDKNKITDVGAMAIAEGLRCVPLRIVHVSRQIIERTTHPLTKHVSLSSLLAIFLGILIRVNASLNTLILGGNRSISAQVLKSAQVELTLCKMRSQAHATSAAEAAAAAEMAKNLACNAPVPEGDVITVKVPGVQPYRITKQLSTLGRSHECDIVVTHKNVSRVHAEIQWESDVGPGEYVLRDRGSTNGIEVNGHRILAQRPLSDGDRVSLGGSPEISIIISSSV
jgi:hypothetical protein